MPFFIARHLLLLLLLCRLVTARTNKTAFFLNEHDGALSHALGLEMARAHRRLWKGGQAPRAQRSLKGHGGRGRPASNPTIQNETKRNETASANDGFCLKGIRTIHEMSQHHLCCAASCGTCGEGGCATLQGGAEQCCVRTIFGSGKECSGSDDTGCIVPSKNATTVVPELVSHPYPFPYSVSSLSAWDGSPKDGVSSTTTITTNNHNLEYRREHFGL